MLVNRVHINGIPALIWGEPSDKVWLCVHGKMSSKESAEGIARIAAEKGYQTICFDLPQHGERKNEAARCDIWNGIHDLTCVADYVFARWQEVNLYACSLGAYFSLQTLVERTFRQCIFQSPILDMEHLIRKMFLWFGITEERLEREKEINTPIDLMQWDYFQYVLAHPVEKWTAPTSILFGGRDDLQSLEVVEAFARRFGCEVTVAEHSAHSFMEEGDCAIVERWLREHI